MLDIQDKPKFKKHVSNQYLSQFPKDRDDRFSSPKPNKVRNTSSPNKKPTCAKCEKGYVGECLVGT